MKLVKIAIVNFGQFSDMTIDLPSSDINVFFGSNEAGKSTIVAFIKQIMFGFHLAKHKSDFFEDYQPLARVSPMGGSLFFENAQGDIYELERLFASGKGSKAGTLTVKLNDQAVPESTFFDQIKNIDGSFFADSFIFNQDMLAKVSSIQQTDLLERIYYLGAADSDKLIDLRDFFAKKASELFKKGGSKPPLNQLIKRLQSQKSKVDDAESEFTTYQELNSDFKNLQQQQKEYENELLQLQKKQNKLQHLQNLIPSYQELTSLEKQLKPVEFDEEKYQEAQTLSLKLQSLEDHQRNLQERLAQLNQNQENMADASKLLQKKPALLQWQAEDHNCSQKNQQLANERQQLLALDPELSQIAKLDQTAVAQLQEEYQKLLSLNTDVVVQEDKQGQSLLVLGVVLVLIGIVLILSISKIGGCLLVMSGIVFFLLGIKNQQKQTQIQKRAQKRKLLAEKQRTAFTAKYGLKPDRLDITRLINDWRQFQTLEHQNKVNLQKEQQLADQLKQLAIEISAVLHQRVQPDFTIVVRAMDELDNKYSQSRYQQEAATNLKNNLAENSTALKKANLSLQTAMAEFQVHSMAEYANLQAQKQKQTELQTQISILQKNLAKDLPQLKSFLLESQTVTDQNNQLLYEIKKCQEKLQTTQSAIAEIKVKMANLANSTAVFAAKQELADLQTDFRNLSAKYLANVLACEWVGRALDLASNERFPKMLVVAKDYLRLLTNNRYNNIEVGKKLTVSRYDGKKIKVQYLSRGTSEQLYFALKLAFVQQIGDQINLPILIDDSFVNFDDQRTELIKDLLKQIAMSNQILIFTAQDKIVGKLQHPILLTKGTQNV
ncbi:MULTISPECIES: AAA family ATPase [unclassified Lactobacillus]|uniref:ATP-binding protein n=1 Tax=unclassified Lactobacillus TaxID=2620435 RepID=UPI000EFA6D93|nr:MULTISPECIES: AAA family ATPase [unclassified Lactobacillus]RMC24227.1 DNA repair protein [Lactobacillus sp. ESL0247]RMC28800.1 DNA repair protein [Lactobacillus sp. ESL0246]RMC31457.1 DNA repair protein [Lactobacillus sp. ESL0245]